MKKQQVSLVTGTDSSRFVPFVIPGISLFDELEELVTAGLSPFANLQI